MSEKNKEGVDNFQEDLDTDTYDFKGADGIERDKRGELLVLLPDSGTCIARRRGFSLSRDADAENGGPGMAPPIEKGSQFSVILRDDKGIIPVGQTETKGLVAELPGTEKPGDAGLVDYGQTEVLVPDKPIDKSALTVDDFDLDFSLPDKKPAGTTSPPEPGQTEQESRKVKTRPTWMPPKESMPVPPPEQKMERETIDKSVPFDEPELPDTGPPVIIKRQKPEKAPEPGIKDKPATPPIEAHSYLEDESVVKKPPPAPTQKHTRKKMKLPKAVKEKRGNPVLVLLMLLLLVILAGVLAVQYVPQAREYYDSAIAKVFKTKKRTPHHKHPGKPEDNMFEVTVGGKKVFLKKGTNLEAVKAYTAKLGEILSSGRRAASGEERK